MEQYAEDAVREHLEPYHGRLWSVINRAHEEQVALKRARAELGFAPVLYARTNANSMFDAVARYATAEFAGDADVRVLHETQTVKFAFGDVVLLRFKKGDQDHLGQNLPTQRVLDFVSMQNSFAGFPPSATKIEILYATKEVEERLDSVIVAARDGDNLLWYYSIDSVQADREAVVPFPQPMVPRGEEDDSRPLIVPIRRSGDKPSTDGN